MATYITGDCHQRFDKIYNFIYKMNLTENDNIIVLGDMGLFWRYDKQDADMIIDFYEDQFKCNLYFIDGNHENFNLLKHIPIIDATGIGKVSKHIFYIPRGTVVNFEGKKCLCLGGADSIDKGRRTENLGWWADEQITQEQIDNVIAGHYDYVFTHAAPRDIVDYNKAILCDPRFADLDIDTTSENRLQQLRDKITFDHWCFGHYHQDVHLDDKYACYFHSFEEVK